jgi:hypothetical protein
VRKEGNHAFSIELKSKEYLKNIVISNRTGETVLVEGFLGELEELSFVEGAMLELRGSNGVLRIDLKEDELAKLFNRLARGSTERKLMKNE